MALACKQDPASAFTLTAYLNNGNTEDNCRGPRGLYKRGMPESIGPFLLSHCYIAQPQYQLESSVTMFVLEVPVLKLYFSCSKTGT